MAFVADAETRRTYDPARGIELAGDGGGRGYEHFVFHRLGDIEEQLGGFSASQDIRPASDSEKKKYPEAKAFSLWVIVQPHGPGLPIKGFDTDESAQIIREAMLAYRGVHGVPVDSNVTLYDVSIPNFLQPHNETGTNQ